MDVTIGCPCPGTPHDTDMVTLKEPLDFRTRITVRQTIAMFVQANNGATIGELTGILLETYLLYCIERWTLVDEQGKPVGVSKASIEARLLTTDEAAVTVGDAADALYTESLILPLLKGASTSSRATPTAGSTSPKTSGRTPRRRSRRSLTSITPMVVTGPMQASPAGVSRS